MAATVRIAEGTAVIDHPHPGQNGAFTGTTVAQCGQLTVACTGLAV